jgi:hypothetical protein
VSNFLVFGFQFSTPNVEAHEQIIFFYGLPSSSKLKSRNSTRLKKKDLMLPLTFGTKN